MRDYILSAPDEAALQAVLPDHWDEEGGWDGCAIAGATLWERRPVPGDDETPGDAGEQRPGFHLILRADALPEAAQHYLLTESVDIEPVFAGGLITTPTPDLPEAKRRKRRRVDDLRDYRIAQGFTWTGIPVQTRGEGDLLNISGLYQKADQLERDGVTAPVMNFRDAEDVTHSMTPQQMKALGDAAFDHKSLHFAAAWTLKDAIDAAPDHAALEAIDIEQGWP